MGMDYQRKGRRVGLTFYKPSWVVALELINDWIPRTLKKSAIYLRKSLRCGGG